MPFYENTGLICQQTLGRLQQIQYQCLRMAIGAVLITWKNKIIIIYLY